jgi:hypothetical protein
MSNQPTQKSEDMQTEAVEVGAFYSTTLTYLHEACGADDRIAQEAMDKYNIEKVGLYFKRYVPKNIR